jgi:hypothetical protein
MKANQLVGGRYLIRDLLGGKSQQLAAVDRRSVRFQEAAEHAFALLPRPHRVVEPQLVRHDASAQVGVDVPAVGDRIADRDALRAQRVIDVVADHAAGRLGEEAGAVKGIAARLQDDIELHAVGGTVSIVAGGLHRRFLDRGIVEVVATLGARFR